MKTFLLTIFAAAALTALVCLTSCTPVAAAAPAPLPRLDIERIVDCEGLIFYNVGFHRPAGLAVNMEYSEDLRTWHFLHAFPDSNKPQWVAVGFPDPGLPMLFFRLVAPPAPP